MIRDDTNAVPLVLASGNLGKIREFQFLLRALPVRLMGLSEAGIAGLPEETGASFEENARIKAQAAFDASGLPAMGDDSGLEVLALGGAPGIHSARYAGPDQDARANLDLLLRRMEGIEDRRARFVCALVTVIPRTWLPAQAIAPPFPDGLTVEEDRNRDAVRITAMGTVEGRILRQPRGSGGFGYDPIFYREDLGRTFAEIPEDQKNAISHRGRAVALASWVLSRMVLRQER